MRGVVSGNVGKINKAEYVGQTFLLSFSVAESVYMGANKEKLTCWHKCDYWGKGAEAMAKYLVVGQHVDVMGQSYLQEYTGADGQQGKSLVVKVNDITLGHKPDNAPSVGFEQPGPQGPPSTAQPSVAAPASGDPNYGVPEDIW